MRHDIHEFAGEQDDSWLRSRLGKITASEIYKLEMKGRGNSPSLTRKKLLEKIAFERETGIYVGQPLKTEAMEFGSKAEGFIREVFSLVTGMEVLCVGLVPHAEIATLAASPDGVIVDDDSVLEIKTTGFRYFEHLFLDGDIKRAHYLQMQTAMMCTEASRAHYVVMSRTGFDIIHRIVPRDEDAIQRIRELVKKAEEEIRSEALQW